MKYIIMCGGSYPEWPQPKQLSIVKGEPIVARTIRLLRENGVEDISISSNHPAFEKFGVPVLHHENPYVEKRWSYWVDCFYPMDEPCCYVFGDVVFSPNAIRTIIKTQTDDIEFFASAKPFGRGYPKRWVEPFAFKVVNQEHLKEAVRETRKLAEENRFKRRPIAWEFWTVVKKTPLNVYVENYTAINDYTCDVDLPEDIEHYNRLMGV
ncbi:MAG: NTP transferase domain-containing protein [Clostridiales bacterium]|nr:NTP transferase domain-containing protein [Clostridiales bacterium]